MIMQMFWFQNIFNLTQSMISEERSTEIPLVSTTVRRYNFFCERWFGRDKEDGLIDRVVALTTEDEMSTFHRRFSEHRRIGITDSHLWLSCLLRPERSTFTRAQRVSCCLALLLLTMITSVMFYNAEDNETGDSTSEYRCDRGIIIIIICRPYRLSCFTSLNEHMHICLYTHKHTYWRV